MTGIIVYSLLIVICAAIVLAVYMIVKNGEKEFERNTVIKNLNKDI